MDGFFSSNGNVGIHFRAWNGFYGQQRQMLWCFVFDGFSIGFDGFFIAILDGMEGKPAQQEKVNIAAV